MGGARGEKRICFAGAAHSTTLPDLHPTPEVLGLTHNNTLRPHSTAKAWHSAFKHASNTHALQC